MSKVPICIYMNKLTVIQFLYLFLCHSNHKYKLNLIDGKINVAYNLNQIYKFCFHFFFLNCKDTQRNCKEMWSLC